MIQFPTLTGTSLLTGIHVRIVISRIYMQTIRSNAYSVNVSSVKIITNKYHILVYTAYIALHFSLTG